MYLNHFFRSYELTTEDDLSTTCHQNICNKNMKCSRDCLASASQINKQFRQIFSIISQQSHPILQLLGLNCPQNYLYFANNKISFQTLLDKMWTEGTMSQRYIASHWKGKYFWLRQPQKSKCQFVCLCVCTKALNF